MEKRPIFPAKFQLDGTDKEEEHKPSLHQRGVHTGTSFQRVQHVTRGEDNEKVSKKPQLGWVANINIYVSKIHVTRSDEDSSLLQYACFP